MDGREGQQRGVKGTGSGLGPQGVLGPVLKGIGVSRDGALLVEEGWNLYTVNSKRPFSLAVA